MFESILDCPRCQKRFHYEHDDDQYPAYIVCPECGEESPSGEFSVLMLCHQCHSKLKVPVEILGDEDNVCPKCGAAIKSDFLDTMHNDLTTIADGEFKRESKRMLQDGEIFDKYKIIKLLGKGGMAEVYLAEHLLLKQTCALKLMQNKLNNDDSLVFVKRFIREAKLTHSLNAPNIVRVFDAGSDFRTGYLFLAMEYVEGKTLLNIIHEKKLSEGELLELLNVMGNALKVLEEARIVHRDIKPSNIMYNSDEGYKLMDLGIARMESNHQAGDLTLTMEQTTIGTPGYASPEQCRSAHQVDNRSDIFSLGATVYHAATGNVPFAGDTPVEIILNVMQSVPEPIKKFRSDLSNGFVLLIQKMMSPKPSERFQNADELLAVIRDLRSGKTAFGKKLDTIRLLSSSNASRQKKGLFKAVAGIIAVCLIGGGIFLFSRDNPRSQAVQPAAAVAGASSVSVPAVKTAAAAAKKETAQASEKAADRKKSTKKTAAVPVKAVRSHAPEKTKKTIPEGPVIEFKKQGKAIVPTLAVNNDDLKKTLPTASTTLEEQLKQIRENYRLFERRCQLMSSEKLTEEVPEDILAARQDIIRTAQEMLPLWKKRIEYLEKRNKMIAEVRKKRYSQTRKFQDAFNDYCRKLSSFNFRGEKSETEKELVALLQDPGVDPNATVLFWNQRRRSSEEKLAEGKLFEAIRSTGGLISKKAFIQTLCSRYADPSAFTRGSGMMFSECLPLVIEYGLPLHAIRSTQLFLLTVKSSSLPQEEVAKMLRLLWIDGAWRDPEILSQAARSGVREYLLITLAMGIDPNLLNSDRETALFETYRNDDGEKLRTLLLAAGADPDIRNNKGEKASDLQPDDTLLDAWKKQDIARIKECLDKKGISGKLLPDGNTFLIDACLKRNVELVKLLLEKNADPNQKNGKTDPEISYPLLAATQLLQNGGGDAAERRKEIEIVKLLLEHKAKWAVSAEGGLVMNPKNLFNKLIETAPERNILLPIFVSHIELKKQIDCLTVERVLLKCSGQLTQSNRILFMDKFPPNFLCERMGRWLYYCKVDKKILLKALNHGLSPKEKTFANDAPLIYWAVYGKQSYEVIETLLKAGADPDVPNSKGETAFRRAQDRKIQALLRKYSKKRKRRSR